ncbi:Uncharacterised protein [Mycobacteroides abscessus subsp. abscessus]|nr:Uncharacterised protein [Mycobacteroides abscessus subsp. abscessus]
MQRGPRSGRLGDHAGHQSSEARTAGIEFGDGTDVGDPPVVEHGHTVGQHQRRPSMREDEHRRPCIAAAAQVTQDARFGCGVDGRCRVVENEHTRVGIQCAGERDALSLAAREGQAPLADDGVESVGQCRDELERVGAGRGVDQAWMWRAVRQCACIRGNAECDVGGDGVGVEERFVEDDGDRGMQTVGGERGDIVGAIGRDQ